MPKLVSRTLAVLGLFLPVPEWWRCNAGNSKSLSLFPSDSVLIFVVYRFFGMWPNASHLKDIPFPWSSCQSPCLLIAPKHLLLREQRNDFAFGQRPWLISGQTSGIWCPETVPDQRFKPETESGKKWFNTGKKWFEKVNHPKSGFITSFIMWKVGKSGLILGKSGLKKLITQKVVSSQVSSCGKVGKSGLILGKSGLKKLITWPCWGADDKMTWISIVILGSTHSSQC